MTGPSSREDDVVDAIVGTLCAAAPSICAGLSGRCVYGGGMNPNGERQLEADTYADGLLLKHLHPLDGVGGYASKKRPDIIDTDEGVSVTLDPLDGSTNLKPNNAMGTLYSIYDESLPTSGKNLLAAGYIPYGPVTTLMADRDSIVSKYILESDIKHPLCEELMLPGGPTTLSFGGRANHWLGDFEAFAHGTERTEGMRLRYDGSMIDDMNQILHYGDIFTYSTQTDAPGGKLRQQFEDFPIDYIIECACGRSSDGEQSLLSGTPEGVHNHVPVYIGNDSFVKSLETRLD